MHQRDIEASLYRIFETGLFCQAAILAHKEELVVVSRFEAILTSYSEPVRTDILKCITNHVLDHGRKPLALESLASLHQIIDDVGSLKEISSYFNRHLSLTWPLFVFSEMQKRPFTPESLLSIYCEVHQLTNGFRRFDNAKLQSIIDKFSFLTKIREKKFLIVGRTSYDFTRSGEETGLSDTIYIFYNPDKTSMRQALLNSIALFDPDSDCLEHFERPARLNNLAQLRRLLVALDYSVRTEHSKLSRDKYLAYLSSAYPVLTESGLSDARALKSSFEAFDEYSTAIRAFYSRNSMEFEREQRVIASKKSKMPLEINSHHDNVKPIKKVRLFLATFITYYAYLIANKSFFKELQSLKNVICSDLQSQGVPESNIESLTALTLNHIGQSPATSKASCEFDEVIARILFKYKTSIDKLGTHSVPLLNCGYFFIADFYPTLGELFRVVVCLLEVEKKHVMDTITIRDLTEHEIFDSLCVTNSALNVHTTPAQRNAAFDTYYKRALTFRSFLPLKTEYAAPMLGYGYPMSITCMGNGESTIDYLKNALTMLDDTALAAYLDSTLASEPLKTYQSLLIGMFYFYQIEWEDKTITNSQCLSELDEIYPSDIDLSKLRYAKAKAQNFIDSLSLASNFNPD